jgi:hypothetical protein
MWRRRGDGRAGAARPGNSTKELRRGLSGLR